MHLQRLTPMLSVADLSRTIAFYCDDLGFRCVRTFGNPRPVWCHLQRDGVDLMFNMPPADPDGYWLWFGQSSSEPATVSE